MAKKSEQKIKNELITKKDIKKAWFHWNAFSETSLNFERLQALAFCNSMLDILKKLYPNKEDLSEALKRHLTMYNTQANWGTVINGITIALEEKAASETEEEKKTTNELITSLKTGLMGPVAGIGDTLDFGTFRPIVMGICIPFAMNGSFFGSLIPLIYQVTYMWFISKFAIQIGYQKGKDSIVEILHSGKVRKIIAGAGMFGLFMMGALSATYVKITTPLKITTGGGNTIVIQDMLDKIVPSLLPILVVFAIYFYIQKKGPHYLRILLCILVASLGLTFLGVL
jgi:D-glucosaminate-specific PTS system IID component